MAIGDVNEQEYHFWLVMFMDRVYRFGDVNSFTAIKVQAGMIKLTLVLFERTLDISWQGDKTLVGAKGSFPVWPPNFLPNKL